jgi:transposase
MEAAPAKEARMDFWDRMKNTMEKGLESSRDLLGKAKDRAQDLGERGVLRLEIKQLENQAEKLIGKLGTRAYEALVTEQRVQIDKQTEGVAELIAEIDEVRQKIREKEAALEIAMRKEEGESQQES